MEKNAFARFNYFDTMARAQKGYARLLEPICKKWNLTRNELDVILFLANNPDYDRAVDIVNHRGLSKSHVSLSINSLESRGLTLTWDESVREYLVKKAYSMTYGARNLRRTIQKDLEDPISEKIIDSFENPISQLHIQVADNSVTVTAQ